MIGPDGVPPPCSVISIASGVPAITTEISPNGPVLISNAAWPSIARLQVLVDRAGEIREAGVAFAGARVARHDSDRDPAAGDPDIEGLVGRLLGSVRRVEQLQEREVAVEVLATDPHRDVCAVRETPFQLRSRARCHRQW